MKKPLVAIVGRPNVGKSTMFNKIVGKRISIESDEAGVTRDRIFAAANWLDYDFMLCDTGGLDFQGDDEINSGILNQAKIAIEMADEIMFVTDSRDGVTPTDHDIAKVLRKYKKPIFLVVNKVDNFDKSLEYEFYELGLGQPYLISSIHGIGIGDLLDAVVKNFPKVSSDTEDDNVTKIAIVGKPNAGKSSLINRLLGEERVIVSNVAGTTRDSIDVPFKWNKKKYILVDTAGMRRKSKIEDETVERYSIIRTLKAVTDADIVLMVIDATAGVSDQDKKIASYVESQAKPSVIVINKWDLIPKETMSIQKFGKILENDFAFMPYFKTVYLSALTGEKTQKLMPAVEEVMTNASRKVQASALNDVLTDAFVVNPPNFKNGKKGKIYYATQTDIRPPEFLLFVNKTELIEDNYLRFLENTIRKSFDFSGTPIRIKLRAKSEEEL